MKGFPEGIKKNQLKKLSMELLEEFPKKLLLKIPKESLEEFTEEFLEEFPKKSSVKSLEGEFPEK